MNLMKIYVLHLINLDLKRGIEKEVENDPMKLEARMKQVLYGKNTIGYDNYTAAVPR